MEKLYEKLVNADVGKVRQNEPLSRHTTIKIGGPADLFIEPSSMEGLMKTMEIIREAGIPWRAIGRGSNLLVDDKGIEGAVIKIGRGLHFMEFEEGTVRVGAGYPLVPLATIMSKKGYKGFEFTGGIPGSVGGAVYMNAGAHGSDTSRILEKAHILYPDGTLKWLSNEELRYSYRTSRLQIEKGICVEAVFKLNEGDANSIIKEMQQYKEYRHSTQPYNDPCCGSVFRNPLPHHAGKLIQDLGLKGYSIGGAKISDLHGNFIVNAGGATARNVLDLIRFIQKEVKKHYQIDMHTEVEIVPRKEGSLTE
ncbi:MAG: UDP-N-acetylmuramate dehydrogenase [Tuberibacillus sp.]